MNVEIDDSSSGLWFNDEKILNEKGNFTNNISRSGLHLSKLNNDLHNFQDNDYVIGEAYQIKFITITLDLASLNFNSILNLSVYSKTHRH